MVVDVSEVAVVVVGEAVGSELSPLPPLPGGQFNSFVEISTDFSTEFLVLQGVPHYYKNSVENSVEISTKLLN